MGCNSGGQLEFQFDGEMKDAGENAEYDAFVEKFKPKKTTDDCYTPPSIYEVIADWVAAEYNLDRADFVRPFYPGGDYEHFNYTAGCVVVDNPPFSLLSQIIKFYMWKDIKFFLFAPALTLLSSSAAQCCAVCAHVEITYENGARVRTSFLTNLEDTAIRSAPELNSIIKAADEENRRKNRKELPKYVYPPEVLTAVRCGYFSERGIKFSVPRGKASFIRAMEAQRPSGKGLFGAGYLLSKAAAAQASAARAAAAQVWELSERERAICAALDDE